MRIEKLNHLVAKLNAPCRNTLDEAVRLCGLRTNAVVEIEHWLQAIIGSPGTDFSRICSEYEINLDRLLSQITARLDRLKRGSGDSPRLSERVLELIGQAWLIASIDFKASRITTGHLVCAMQSDEQFSPLIELTELSRVPVDSLRNDLATIVKDSFESDAETSVARSESRDEGGDPTPTVSADQSALGKFTVDLTELASQGKIDPVIGRDSEINQIIDILMRRRQNNPILTGEAGVGKTAVAEGFAMEIKHGDVPDRLKTTRVLTLDLGALQAGAGVKGEFERRLKGVIDEVKQSAIPIILFIDEAHNLVGAGGAAGQGDAANLLKPALARGELRTIAATTWAEYKKYFESDAALSRRFQVVKVEEPTHAVAVEMMQGLIPTLEEHHGVRIEPDAILSAVDLSSRYIAGRQLPDKSVSLLDTTCARIALSQSATPPAVKECRRKIRALEVSRDILDREARAGKAKPEQQQQVVAELEEARRVAQEIEQRWEKEHGIASEIKTLTMNLVVDGDEPLSDDERDKMLEQLKANEKELLSIQGEMPLIHPTVTSDSVAETVESWTGIPVGRMVADEIDTVLNLKQRMEESIIGQSHALDVISERIITSRAGMRDPKTPIGVFMLAGTSGVGKTETAIALAELLYGGEQNMTVINMTEFKEEHKVSQLMGPPPGYKGYEEGGVLTEAVRRKPYSVVLLDEVEKAHEGVQEIFYQVFDKGSMRDGQGRDIDFKNTVIIMTTNASSDFIANLCADPETAPTPEAFLREVKPKLLESFKPAFLNRSTVVPYYPLDDSVLKKIVRLKLSKVERRVTDEYGATCRFSDEVVSQIAQRCTEADAGARNIDHIVNKNILPRMSVQFLSRVAAGQPVVSVDIVVGEDGELEYQIQ